ncbi:CBFD NFYB HMF domain-containing protein [Citrus sinensis]|uniref:CBFD NFYB HMF domain-containing protein n=1 Tax=Citrus sinensis TaxID=2711 RepID=A0ACB8K5I5_CITSI|nr:CBFD NFYB HMF domain-containing protein [Citrus sinensis]
MRRPKVDLNVSEDDFTPSSTPSQDAAPVHNFMPMTPFMLPSHQPTEEDEEEAHSLALMLKQRQLVQSFWEQQKSDIENATTESLRNHLLPLARIKKVMKSREEVKMTTADSPAVFAKACEMFIMELTLRAWLQTEDGKRRTLQRCDIARALRLDELFDFLIDFVPYDCRQNFMTPSMIDPKVQQQVMMKPSPSIAEFDYGSTAKVLMEGYGGRKSC